MSRGEPLEVLTQSVVLLPLLRSLLSPLLRRARWGAMGGLRPLMAVPSAMARVGSLSGEGRRRGRRRGRWGRGQDRGRGRESGAGQYSPSHAAAGPRRPRTRRGREGQSAERQTSSWRSAQSEYRWEQCQDQLDITEHYDDDDKSGGTWVDDEARREWQRWAAEEDRAAFGYGGRCATRCSDALTKAQPLQSYMLKKNGAKFL
ncbi:unnamed protein product [Prorocentrum cordatum]|uniref:Uncharacterized protein n=1 Tax=Prorocentrum cordatum TaxID=2364126 RepID=A0ABN9VTW5_9DINO|nr:unnamed protein product [Polarella glacialis]